MVVFFFFLFFVEPGAVESLGLGVGERGVLGGGAGDVAKAGLGGFVAGEGTGVPAPSIVCGSRTMPARTALRSM